MHPELVRKLIKPSKVASIFDWKKTNNCTVLALNFHKNRVGIAIGYHPSFGIPCYELEPLRFDNGSIASHDAIDQNCLNRFTDITETFKVCGVIVNWPVQHDTGRMGAACGRVIYALEKIWEQNNGNNNNSKTSNEDFSYSHDDNSNSSGNCTGLQSRPFCLWDTAHIDLKQRTDPSKRVDAFGRCASYSGCGSNVTRINRSDDEHKIYTSTTTMLMTVPESNKNNTRIGRDYFASKEQYHEDELTVVVGVWNDFSREHWPTLTTTAENLQVQEKEQQAQSNNNYSNNNKYPPPEKDQESTLGYLSPPSQQGITNRRKSLI